MWSAFVFGIVNALLAWLVGLVTFPFQLFGQGVATLVVNMILFGITAWLVQGFRLRHGLWSALLGSILLTVVNQLLRQALVSVIG